MKKKKKTALQIQVEVMAATRGPATNVRPGGPMEDRRTKRMRTRADKERAALLEQVVVD